MEKHEVYAECHVDSLVDLYLGGAERYKLDTILDICASLYKRLDEDGQIEFKSAAKGFVRTYGFLGAILPYGNPEYPADDALVRLTATVTQGGTTYNAVFRVKVPALPPVVSFVPVTSIIGVPSTATAGTSLTLNGTVNPSNATNKAIVWSVQNAGSTGAIISGNALRATSAGTVTVRATITNGLTETREYSQPFSITVRSNYSTDRCNEGNESNGGGGAQVASTLSLTPTSTPTPDDDEEEITDEGVPLDVPTLTPPTCLPLNLSAEETEHGIRLMWTLCSHNDEYWIYRSTVSGENGEALSTRPLPADGGKYFDTGVEPNTTYYYTIFLNEHYPNFGETIEITTTDILDMPADDEEGEENVILMQIGNETMIVNNVVKRIDPGRDGTAPCLVNSRTLLPIRAIVEEMGGLVTWDEIEKRITLEVFNIELVLWLNSYEILVNGVPMEIDVAPQTINDRTMLPIRYVAENIGCRIGWIGSTQEIVVLFISS